MLARHEGRIVLVAGAIPGERVRARIERTHRRVLWAEVAEVLSESADRRHPPCDPGCGGMAYAHVRYERQLALKREVVADAFGRIGRLSLPADLPMHASPETGYRLRASLKVRDGECGFFRTSTHELCDAADTRQLSAGAVTAAREVVAALGRAAGACEAIDLAENVAGTERVAHLRWRRDAPAEPIPAPPVPGPSLSGLTADRQGRIVPIAGLAAVTDTAAELFAGAPPIDAGVAWTRHGPSFFQGNRFLVGALARRVLELSHGRRHVDLYAGVGLFSIALAARGDAVLAVEGDRHAGADLADNARRLGRDLTVMRAAVEHVASRPLPVATDSVIVDPPRTGLSAASLGGVLDWRVPRVVYVSCDPATMARDAARFVDAGYRLSTFELFDMFPGTPHVESVAAFDRA